MASFYDYGVPERKQKGAAIMNRDWHGSGNLGHIAKQVAISKSRFLSTLRAAAKSG